MLSLKYVCEKPADIKKNLIRRGYDTKLLDKIVAENEERKKVISEVEQLKALQNSVSKEIVQLKKTKKETGSKISEMKKVSDQAKALSQKRSIIEEEIQKNLLLLPNVLDAAVPDGKSDRDNKEIRKWGTPPQFDFKPKDHMELGEKLKLIDHQRAAKIAGARFALYRGLGAKLVRALINFMIDTHVQAGYQETFPPLMVHRNTMTGTGQFPKFESEAFKIDQIDSFLIPTAEVPLCNIYRDEILSPEMLPMNLTAYTPCFRKEAGSYGQDVKGLIRLHQFNKVEIVKIVVPESSEKELEQLTQDAEKILQLLKLPYRVVMLCSSDTGFAAAKTYDLEVWLPSQNRYREISSCSNCADFQSRRMNMRYRKDKKTKPIYPHILNGSAMAIDRTIVALLENFQRKDGTIELPKILEPYMGTRFIS